MCQQFNINMVGHDNPAVVINDEEQSTPQKDKPNTNNVPSWGSSPETVRPNNVDQPDFHISSFVPIVGIVYE